VRQGQVLSKEIAAGTNRTGDQHQQELKNRDLASIFTSKLPSRMDAVTDSAAVRFWRGTSDWNTIASESWRSCIDFLLIGHSKPRC